MEGVGESYRERQRRRVECSICGKDLAASSLDSHYRTVHGTVPQGDVGQADAPGCQPAEYRVSFPKIACPVAGCSGNASSWTNLCRHFTYRHPRDVIVILEEGRLPQCELCGMHVLLAALAGGHRNSAFCREGVACNRQPLAAKEAALARGVSFTVQGTPLEHVWHRGRAAWSSLGRGRFH
jgi:hypothetical protein